MAVAGKYINNNRVTLVTKHAKCQKTTENMQEGMHTEYTKIHQEDNATVE